MLFVACLIALGPVFLGFPARGFIDCFAALLDLLGMLLLAWPHTRAQAYTKLIEKAFSLSLRNSRDKPFDKDKVTRESRAYRVWAEARKPRV